MNIKGVFLAALIVSGFELAAQQKLEVQDVVIVALEKSYDIQLSKNLTRSSNTDARNAKGLFLPDVTLNASRNNSFQQIHTEFEDRPTSDTKPEANVLNYNAQVNWVLFDGLKMFATYKQLQAVAGVNETLLKNQMANTMALVINNYYSIVAQKQQLRAINEQISVSEERIKLAERKLQVGSGIKTELLQAKLDQNAFRTSALQQEATIIQTKANLNTVSGNQLPDQFEVSDTIPLNLDLTIEEIFQGMESTNPTLIAARGNIEVAKYNLNARRGDRFPIISLTSGYSNNQLNNTVAPNATSPTVSQTKNLSVGFTGTWFVLNNLIITNALQLAKINLDRQQIVYEQQKAIAYNGVRIAYADYDNARKTLAIEEENIQLARENVSILLETFKRGATTFIELRTAQQSMVDAYNRLTTARYNAKVSETELLRLKGALLR